MLLLRYASRMTSPKIKIDAMMNGVWTTMRMLKTPPLSKLPASPKTRSSTFLTWSRLSNPDTIVYMKLPTWSPTTVELASDWSSTVL